MTVSQRKGSSEQVRCHGCAKFRGRNHFRAQNLLSNVKLAEAPLEIFLLFGTDVKGVLWLDT